ncbi:hypothetical protein LTR46_005854 [Exophiala xenobiotica]|nr:hypothetical protein LTR46_005854 [Exophiala xenobiotica]
METEIFRHERLSLSGRFMRLLQIQGGTGIGTGTTKKDNRVTTTATSSVISLRITQYAIHRRPPYVAISYTWGSAAAGDTREIRVNGRAFRVRVNLWNLLFHLRQRGEARFLWIDALCIDQQNLEERNWHVQRMARIYDSAQKTVVWLGMPSEDRRQARGLEFVVELAAAAARARQGGGAGAGAGAGAAGGAWEVMERMEARWKNLLELCRGVYWTRTWIIQEFLRARGVEVVVGTASLEWTLFEDVVRLVREKERERGRKGGSEDMPAWMGEFMHTLPVRLTGRRISHEQSTLEELLAGFYDSKCAERRDKIYGILGIADDCGEDETTGQVRGPRPDYAKNIVEVYFEVCKYLCQKGNGSLSVQAVYLAQRALEISQADIAGYIDSLGQGEGGDGTARLEDVLKDSTCLLVPDYVNVIDEVLPGWTSIRDLRQKLELVDWSRYVGHEVKRKTSRSSTPSQRNGGGMSGGRQTEYVVSPLPPGVIENVVQAAARSEDLRHLHNYPSAKEGRVPVEYILLHKEDKRMASNPGLARPSIVIESNPALGVDPVRLGFACSDVRAGDLICQFTGVDVTLIARRVAGGHGGLKIVGRARMIGHSGLKERALHPGCRSGQGPGGGKPWSGLTLVEGEDGQGPSGNEENWMMETDPISLWEVLGMG